MITKAEFLGYFHDLANRKSSRAVTVVLDHWENTVASHAACRLARDIEEIETNMSAEDPAQPELARAGHVYDMNATLGMLEEIPQDGEGGVEEGEDEDEEEGISIILLTEEGPLDIVVAATDPVQDSVLAALKYPPQTVCTVLMGGEDVTEGSFEEQGIGEA